MNVKIIPRKLAGSIEAIPSKSHLHRIMIARKLAHIQTSGGRSFAALPVISEDIAATKNCLDQMSKSMPYMDCMESGSTIRFLLPVTMALKDEAVFLGTGRLPERPLSPMKEEMEKHGCKFEMRQSHEPRDAVHMEICRVKGRLNPGKYFLPGNISSQFITGLLFALPILDGDSTLTVTTEIQSAGYVDLTLDVLKDFGICISVNPNSEGYTEYDIKGGQLFKEPENIPIEGDWSNSAFWLAAGALNGDITCTGLDPRSPQRDKQIVHILKSMGAPITVSDGTDGSTDINTKAVCGGSEGKLIRLGASEISVSQIPDLVPVLAAVLALSEGSSLIINAERLKIKESDRLNTVCGMISSLGGDISYGGTALSITGMPFLRGGTVDSRNDHRIAMAAAIAACRCAEPVIIRNADAVKKSYPDFFTDYAKLGGMVQECLR